MRPNRFLRQISQSDLWSVAEDYYIRLVVCAAVSFRQQHHVYRFLTRSFASTVIAPDDWKAIEKKWQKKWALSALTPRPPDVCVWCITYHVRVYGLVVVLWLCNDTPLVTTHTHTHLFRYYIQWDGMHLGYQLKMQRLSVAFHQVSTLFWWHTREKEYK